MDLQTSALALGVGGKVEVEVELKMSKGRETGAEIPSSPCLAAPRSAVQDREYA